MGPMRVMGGIWLEDSAAGSKKGRKQQTSAKESSVYIHTPMSMV
jgi:hypothetical protein